MAPNMVGDFFMGAGNIYSMTTKTSTGVMSTTLLGTIPAAGGTRRVKISDNNSPIPRDRVFFDFNDFQNSLAVPGSGTSPGYSASIQRYMPGFEKTFFNGWASIDIRAPFADAQNPNINTLTPNALKSTVFGNTSVTLKTLLWRTDRAAISGGFGVNTPTAGNVQLLTSSATGVQSITINNDAVHLLPFLGLWLRPTERVFVTGFVQMDLDANGNLIHNNTSGTLVGALNDQTLIYADMSIAYWLYRKPENRYLTGVVPYWEYHFTGSLQNPDLVSTTSGSAQVGNIVRLQFGNTVNQFDISNLTTGAHLYIGPKSVLTLGGVLPLNRSQNQRQFDSELIALFNRYF
jgi:hypothetical protein